VAISEDLATDIDIMVAMWCQQRQVSGVSWEDRCALRKMVYDLFMAEGRADAIAAWNRRAGVAEAVDTAHNTGSPKLLNSLRRVLPLVKNGMSSMEINDVRGVIADAIDQLRAGA